MEREAALREPAVALVHRHPPEQHRAEREHANSGHQRRGCRPSVHGPGPEHDDGEQRADEQLRRARVRAVIDTRPSRIGCEHPAEEDGRADARDEHRREDSPASTPRAQDERSNEREDDVELLLDRERPEVQHRRRSAEQLRIRPADCEEVPVRDVPERREHVAA